MLRLPLADSRLGSQELETHEQHQAADTAPANRIFSGVVK